MSVPCDKGQHRYRWSGRIPCTGVRRCIFCGVEAPEPVKKLVTAPLSEEELPELWRRVEEILGMQ